MSHRVNVIGNLGKDPEARYLPSGDMVCNFSVASSKKWKNRDGEQQERTVWFRISVFSKQAEACNQYLAKGSKVSVWGEMDADPATGNPKMFKKSDGSQGSAYEIRASDVEFLSPKSEGGGQSPAGDDSDAEIPF